ncbi:hypothetical protein C2E25_05695 [Geothermobacter hydrogeniphilus]|uniref:Uncharacterized protein n=1 Tax=Geothermobacter hydrogeniphilus TaxID=1969733 RepID=A0A2K2HBT3_9BACT|nr:hypothetical protein C2E25_05695 [Geothermobacter hydrogeniphilus]
MNSVFSDDNYIVKLRNKKNNTIKYFIIAVFLLIIALYASFEYYKSVTYALSFGGNISVQNELYFNNGLYCGLVFSLPISIFVVILIFVIMVRKIMFLEKMLIRYYDFCNKDNEGRR